MRKNGTADFAQLVADSAPAQEPPRDGESAQSGSGLSAMGKALDAAVVVDAALQASASLRTRGSSKAVVVQAEKKVLEREGGEPEVNKDVAAQPAAANPVEPRREAREEPSGSDANADATGERESGSAQAKQMTPKVAGVAQSGKEHTAEAAPAPKATTPVQGVAQPVSSNVRPVSEGSGTSVKPVGGVAAAGGSGSASGAQTGGAGSQGAGAAMSKAGAFDRLMKQAEAQKPGGARLTQDAEVVPQVARGLAAAMRQRDGTVTMRLAPGNLGPLKATVTVLGGSVVARLEPTTESARKLLDDSKDTLRTALEARGLHVDRIEVSGDSVKAEPRDSGSEVSQRGGDQPGERQTDRRHAERGAESGGAGLNEGVGAGEDADGWSGAPRVRTSLEGGRLRLDAVA